MCHRKTSGRSVDASEGEAATFYAYRHCKGPANVSVGSNLPVALHGRARQLTAQ